ncbi:MAG: ribosome assembly cofactor RimP [Rikenellaceae bacterium]
MIDTKKIVASAEAKMQGDELFKDMFIVHCTSTPSNEVELFVDSDTKVSIDACVALSRAIEEDFDREQEDFSLTVASAGIGEDIRLLRQYPKLIGRSIEVLLLSGIKVIGKLLDASEEGVKVCYEEKQTVEMPSGKKKKQIVEVENSYSFDQIKYVREYLDFK